MDDDKKCVEKLLGSGTWDKNSPDGGASAPGTHYTRDKRFNEEEGGVKTRTLARMFAPISTVFVLGLLAMPLARVAPASAQPRPAYRFDLVQGQGVAVCEAYLARLNMTDYQDPPYCDRLEHDVIPGFVHLHRVPLPAEAVQELLPRVKGFTDHKNQDWQDLENARRQRGGLPFSQPLSDVKNYLGRDIKVWRYDPPVDIDNDGVLDNVIVWHGFGASGHTGRCGQESPYDKGRQVTLRQTQIAYVLTPNNDRIDVFQTMTIFGHPSGGYRIPDQSGRGTVTSDFRPVGPSIGISNTLAVFLRHANKTQQVCEYLMTENGNTTPQHPSV